MVPLYTFIRILLLLSCTVFFVLTVVKLALLSSNADTTKTPGIIAYMSSLYFIHLFSFLNILISGEVPLFDRPASILTFLDLAARLSLFYTVPFFIHSLFPAVWARTVEIILTLFAAGLFLVGSARIVPSVVYTIGVNTILIALGGYALVHGFLSSLRISRKKFHGSRELYYSTVALVSFLISVSFMFPGDLTLIPRGVLDSQYYFFPWHSLMVIAGFFAITFKSGGHWIGELREETASENSRVKLDTIIRKYSLTKRESQIYELLSQHKSYKEIADILCISVPTAKTHILNLYRKLGIKKKSEISGIS